MCDDFIYLGPQTFPNQQQPFNPQQLFNQQTQQPFNQQQQQLFNQQQFFNQQQQQPQQAPTTAAPVTVTTQSPAFIACMANCPTTMETNPVCGTDNVMYGNNRRLDCANACGQRLQANWQSKKKSLCTKNSSMFSYYAIKNYIIFLLSLLKL